MKSNFEIWFKYICWMVFLGLIYFLIPYILCWLFSVPVEIVLNHPMKWIFNIIPSVILSVGIITLVKAKKKYKNHKGEKENEFGY